MPSQRFITPTSFNDAVRDASRGAVEHGRARPHAQHQPRLWWSFVVLLALAQRRA
jgi:hypothetical protein